MLKLCWRNYKEMHGKSSGRWVSWRCSTCQFSCNDKTRTGRHVKAKHIKSEDTSQTVFLDLSVNKVEMYERRTWPC